MNPLETYLIGENMVEIFQRNDEVFILRISQPFMGVKNRPLVYEEEHVTLFEARDRVLEFFYGNELERHRVA